MSLINYTLCKKASFHIKYFYIQEINVLKMDRYRMTQQYVKLPFWTFFFPGLYIYIFLKSKINQTKGGKIFAILIYQKLLQR